MSKQADKNQVFEKEARILSYSRSILKKSQEELSMEELRHEYEVLSKSYGELLGEVKLLTSVSDRLQNKLDRANETVNKKSDELLESNQLLTRARIGRQATTFVWLAAVIFFLLSDWMIDPEFGAASSVPVVIKVGFALALKPMEMLLENILLKTAAKPPQE